MQCDMCGSEERVYKTNIEGSILNVCKACSKFGTVIAPVREEIEVRREREIKEIEKEPEKEIIELVVGDFADRIRRKREELGLKQEDFAKKLNEKESVIHKLETGEFKPSLDMARKLEKVLGIKLVEEYEEEGKATKTESAELTVGDLIKIKKG
ncbi:multiprotein bridging factor aMBF1 [Candidatus Woesearchaeota archaeon]|nr:multiprotein bridging factor aMBF1 [Candidatus Woesearchaeota archaeon]